jgi:hypothetical protein
MKIAFYLLALGPLVFASCVSEAPVATTTTVTREVTTTGPTTGEVLVTQAPPPVRVEMQTVAPGPRYVWTRGYWRWTGVDYVWAPGSWVVRPSLTAVWVEGHWARKSRGWVFIPGHWQ